MKKSFNYIITQVPDLLPVFKAIQEFGPVSDYDAYAALNMGAGFALYVPESDVNKVKEVASSCQYTSKFDVLRAGHVEESCNDEKKVTVIPKNICYEEATLKVR